jgi:hypothetical protein
VVKIVTKLRGGSFGPDQSVRDGIDPAGEPDPGQTLRGRYGFRPLNRVHEPRAEKEDAMLCRMIRGGRDP